MARVKIEDIIDHLSPAMRRALADAVANVTGASVDAAALFREFERQVRRRCQTWETVPDDYVEDD